MFARVVAAELAPDKLDVLLRVSEAQLAAAREQPGFAGFYLLADRDGGRVMTISLWHREEHVRAVEAQAGAVRSSAASEMGIATPAVDTYEVILRA
jgi:heme-degrading monooxygenase HmoA